MFSFLTVTTALGLLVCAFRPRLAVPALALAGATPGGVALVAGGVGLPTFYATSLVVLLSWALSWVLGGGRVGRNAVPGLALFLLFAGVAIAVTLIAPFLFAGQPTQTTTGAPLVPGVVTTSNIAQSTYLLLGVGVFAFVARSRGTTAAVLGIPVGGVVLLSFWRYLSVHAGVPFPEGIFYNSPTAAIIETAPGGAERFRGILSEPSSLATYCLVATAWALSMLRDVRPATRVLLVGLAGVALYLGVVSTSTTFIVAGGLSMVVVGCVLSARFFSAQLRIARSLVLLGVALLVPLIYVVPAISGFVGDSIKDKLGSSSYTDRSGSDVESFDVLFRTAGFGVGLGANRGSSLIASTLGAVGVLGTLLLLVAVLYVLSLAVRSNSYGPAFWVLVVSLITRVVSGPDLSDSSGLFWLSLGLLARGHALEAVDSRLDDRISSRAV